jgi:hypothetical protein
LINDHVEDCFVRDECELARLGVKLRYKLHSN